MKKTFAVAVLAASVGASFSVYAGEDSTERSGVNGTGPEYYAKQQQQCGLERFGGPDAEPCAVQGLRYDPRAKRSDPSTGPVPRVGTRRAAAAGGTMQDDVRSPWILKD